MTITIHLYLLDHTPIGLQDDTAPNVDHRADNKPVPSHNGNQMHCVTCIECCIITGPHHNGTHSRLLEDVENKPSLLPPDGADKTNDGTQSGSHACTVHIANKRAIECRYSTICATHCLWHTNRKNSPTENEYV